MRHEVTAEEERSNCIKRLTENVEHELAVAMISLAVKATSKTLKQNKVPANWPAPGLAPLKM